jgi:methionine aminopeptidase
LISIKQQEKLLTVLFYQHFLMLIGVLKMVMEKCVDGADIHGICAFGEAQVHEQLKKVYKK